MTRPRILLANELGGGNGHVMRLRPVAEALRAEGAVVTCAMRDIVSARPLMAAGFDVLPAPRILEGLNIALLAANYAELMIRAGFDNPERVALIADAWRDFLKLNAPDLVVADFAPGAMLGALVAGMPRASLGTGFALPPDVTPLPPYAPWLGANPARLAAAEQAVLEAVNAALIRHGRPPLTRLAELSNTGHDILCTFRELDHYRGRAGAPRYIGPIYSTPKGVAPPWPQAAGRKVFAYLGHDWPMLPAAMSALSTCCEAAVLALDGAGDIPLPPQGPRLAVSRVAVDLTQVLPVASLVIAHGGMGLVSQALQAGVPLILFPRNPEQAGTALAVAGMNVATVLRGDRTEAEIAAAIAGALGDDALRTRCGQLAARFAGHRADRAALDAAHILIDITKA